MAMSRRRVRSLIGALLLVATNSLVPISNQRQLLQTRAEPPFAETLPSPLTTTASTIRTITTTTTETNALSPAVKATALETWCVSRLEDWYQRSFRIKCPFFRRRAADALDALDMMVRFLIIRHKSLDLPIGCRIQTPKVKQPHLTIDQIYQIILKDWKVHNKKGYYITGRLNTAIYRNDCLFDGPDLDMPVKGLAKYLSAASQLFDTCKSESELLELYIVDDRMLSARWQLRGVLRLPWKPQLPEWTGTTYYHLDQDGLIYLHNETWDVGMVEAFLKTLAPPIARLLYTNDEEVHNNNDDDDGA